MPWLVEQLSPELVLVAPAELRAAALAELREPAPMLAPPAAQEIDGEETAFGSARHPDLERFAFLTEAAEPERGGVRLAWWSAVAVAAALGAAAPVLLALFAR